MGLPDACARDAQHAGSLRLRVVFEGGPELLNSYAVVMDPDGPQASDARTFADWLASGGGRDVIAQYRVGGSVPAFVPWPAADPRDLPR